MELDWFAGVAATQTGLHAAVRAIVGDALSKRVGDTLARTDDVRQSFGVGVGTVQRALELLAERGALHTISRGHLGRRIEAIDIGQCWQAAGLAPVRIVMSPPGSVEVTALEFTLSDELARLGVPYTVHHLPGGNPRLEQLREGQADLTVVSAGTFEGLVEGWSSRTSVVSRQLAPGTYYAPERLLILTTDAAGPTQELRRIAIDRESFDHEALTLAQFPPATGRSYLQVPFPEVPAHVLAGVVDAGIWRITTLAVPIELTGLKTRPMSGPVAIAARDRLSGATIVAWTGRPELRAVLDSLDLAGLPAAHRTAIDLETAAAARLDRARSAADGSLTQVTPAS